MPKIKQQPTDEQLLFRELAA